MEIWQIQVPRKSSNALLQRVNLSCYKLLFQLSAYSLEMWAKKLQSINETFNRVAYVVLPGILPTSLPAAGPPCLSPPYYLPGGGRSKVPSTGVPFLCSLQLPDTSVIPTGLSSFIHGIVIVIIPIITTVLSLIFLFHIARNTHCTKYYALKSK